MSKLTIGHEIEGVMVDHISNLPDCILYDHILSFIPTKEVVRTSILSTRWKNLWASVPNIDFDDALLYSRKIDSRHPSKVISFMNFAERVLRLRGALNLKKFRLTSNGHVEFTRIQSWISNAIPHNIQELELRIRLFAQDPSVIPWFILDSTSLASLMIDINGVVKIPSHISFPCLKTLHLSSITFLNGDSIQKLLSGCPVLEELVLIGSRSKEYTSFIVISSSTLKSLKICCPFEGIKINAPNLVCFHYTGNPYRSNKFLLNNASSLVEVCIHIPTGELACHAADLLKDLSYTVCSLSVSGWFIQSLNFGDNKPLSFPKFPKLIELTLTTEIMNYAFGKLMDLLSFCPILQSICFSEGLSVSIMKNKSTWPSLPICMSNSLKRLTLKNFHGYNSQMGFLQFVLKNACVLERMDIWWSCEVVLKRSWKAMELKRMDKTSTACVINFS